MSMYVLVLAIVIGSPLLGFAQFVDRGEYVEVSKGVKLCSDVVHDTSNKMLDPEHRFWRVASKARINGTQTVEPFVLERSYNRQSGNTTIETHQYDESYAIFFKRDSEHKGMLLMVSPQDGRVEATVKICEAKK